MFYIEVNEDIRLKLLQGNDKYEFFALIEKNRSYLEKTMPRINENRSIEDTEKVIKLFLKQLAENNGFRAGIIYRGKLAGIIGLKYIDWLNKKTEIMYWIDKDHSGKGISTACTKAIIKIVFEELQLNKAIVKINPNNLPSIRIAEKCGFVLEGVLKEEEILLDGYGDLNVYGLINK
ncbi:MAG TPA: GNAT family protein [Candidatus Cloacimonadota bacterium]|nr:GNAT family protein [Candidatus Cloacimonadota bacterium]HOQ80134.1 GNAT family protein [Candidatus Cloacimonadota bacterium]HPK40325.1 GNAT family protein [Candidatus Cloacimonadota bacterium]